MSIRVVPLGAGQDVGRSSIVVAIGGHTILFDCGMHMGYDDWRRFPDFSALDSKGDLTKALTCVVISHFHLDHCGSLPILSEMCGYNGPIFMTHPTRSLCPVLLEDFRKIVVEYNGEKNMFSKKMIVDCMNKVITLNVHQTFCFRDLKITPYYAGHVLGAALFHVQVGHLSVVYTGDYHTSPNRHLRGAWIAPVHPDVLITESTYGTTVRSSRRSREQKLLSKVHECVSAGGKVLLPVFALGRAQELCILLETYWERMDLKVPMYFSTGLTSKALEHYKQFIHWTGEHIQESFETRNLFDFKHISPFDRSKMSQAGPMVLFATPGMLHTGTSLQVFRHWCEDAKNLCIMPGYCVEGTVGHALQKGHRKVMIENELVTVKCQVEYMSFSAHADSRGIKQILRQAKPRNVVLVHGEKPKMEVLCEKIKTELEINCFAPGNGEMVNISGSISVPALVSLSLVDVPECLPRKVLEPPLKRARLQLESVKKEEATEEEEIPTTEGEAAPMWCIVDGNSRGRPPRLSLFPTCEVREQLRTHRVAPVGLSSDVCCGIDCGANFTATSLLAFFGRLQTCLEVPLADAGSTAKVTVTPAGDTPILQVGSVMVYLPPSCCLHIRWGYHDRAVGEQTVQTVRKLLLERKDCCKTVDCRLIAPQSPKKETAVKVERKT